MDALLVKFKNISFVRESNRLEHAVNDLTHQRCGICNCGRSASGC